ncbi:MAG: putative S-adenosylmethionine-dependent methyltransferase [Promethearchaeota archaeon]|nr:MAG: putative S-adenosylmethionine-dependent methyltransferase [Candidatus Lokiarchaeota archaeon]
MPSKKDHYSSRFPDAQLKVFTISESLRRHLYIFKTTTGVFSYKKLDLGTKILITHMDIPQGSCSLLDLGCGYGPIGIVLAYESPQSNIYFIDRNRRAIWCVRENIKLNLPHSQDRLFVYAGDYFHPLKNKSVKFDSIYLNPAVRQGRQEFLDLFKELPEYLKSNGFFEFVLRRKMGAEYVFNYLQQKYPSNHIHIKCKRSGYWVFRYSLSDEG